MKAIEGYTKALVEAIQRSESYIEYKILEQKLMQDPELMQKVDQFRAECFQIQITSTESDFQENMNALAIKASELRENPMVNAYLNAELAICRLMQRISQDLIEGIDLHIPEI